MWKVKILGKELISGIVSIDVSFYNGKIEVIESIKTSKMKDFKTWANSRIKSFEESETLLDEFTIGDIDTTIEEVVKEEVAQTEEEVEDAKKIKDYSDLKKLEEAVSMEVLESDNSELVTLKSKVKKEITIDLIKKTF